MANTPVTHTVSVQHTMDDGETFEGKDTRLGRHTNVSNKMDKIRQDRIRYDNII